MWMERATGSVAGNTLSLKAGGATSAATDKNGGDLLVAGGTATGTGTSKIQFKNMLTGTTGTVDAAASRVFDVFNGHWQSFQNAATTPTVSSCGTSPSLGTKSTDAGGKITAGTGAPTSCTLTFKIPYTNAPSCTVSGTGIAGTYGASTTTTALTITSTIAMTSSVLNYRCHGWV